MQNRKQSVGLNTRGESNTLHHVKIRPIKRRIELTIPRWAVEMTHPINSRIDGHYEGNTGPDADNDEETALQALSAHFLFIELVIMMGYFHEAQSLKGI